MSNYPIDISTFHETIFQLLGIAAIESSVENLEPIDAEMLPLSAYAHLPHAALWRTGGGLENEVLIQFEFAIVQSVEGCSHWNSLLGSSGIARGAARKFNCSPSRFLQKRLMPDNW